MDTSEYFKMETRICNFYKGECQKCPLSCANNKTGRGCSAFVRQEPKKCVEIMEKWAAEQGEVIAENQSNDERSCENCDFDYKREDEYPCNECKERYTLKFKPKVKLNPCPFCEGEAERVKVSYHFACQRWKVMCRQCHSKSGEYMTVEEAVEAWNRRSDQ